MEFPSLGVHCAFPPCSKLDFLPFECDCCHQIFCLDHRAYPDHNCTESYIKDVQVPVCPLCNQPIPVKNGEDPNINVNQHIMRDCKEQKKKLYSNRCSFPGCKKKELVQMTCSSCHKNYCIKHRLESEHDCDRSHQSVRSVSGRTGSQSSSQSGCSSGSHSRPSPSNSRKPQSSLLSQIGADLNRERRERLEGQHRPTSSSTNTTVTTGPPQTQSGLSDEEALSLAIAASLQDTPPSQSTNRINSSNSKPAASNQPNLAEDEAMARAIAASLNETSSSGSGKKHSTGAGRKSDKKSSNEDQCCIS